MLCLALNSLQHELPRANNNEAGVNEYPLHVAQFRYNGAEAEINANCVEA